MSIRSRLTSRSSGAQVEVSHAVGDALHGSGRVLDATVRRDMETRFHHDFSRVRIDDSPRAHGLAATLGAAAFTVGNRIGLAGGAPGVTTTPGRRLIAHELTHVIQQERGTGPPAVDPSLPHEREARAAEQTAASATGTMSVRATTGVGLACAVDHEGLRIATDLQDAATTADFRRLPRESDSAYGTRMHDVFQGLVHSNVPHGAEGRVITEVVVNGKGVIVNFGGGPADATNYVRQTRDPDVYTVDAAILKPGITAKQPLVGRNVKDVVFVYTDFKTGNAALSARQRRGADRHSIPLLKLTGKGDLRTAVANRAAPGSTGGILRTVAKRTFDTKLRQAQAALSKIAANDPGDQAVIDTVTKVSDTLLKAKEFADNPTLFAARRIQGALVQGVFDRFEESLAEHRAAFVSRFPDVASVRRGLALRKVNLDSYRQRYADSITGLRNLRFVRTAILAVAFAPWPEAPSKRWLDTHTKLANDMLAKAPGMAPFAAEYYRARQVYLLALSLTKTDLQDLQKNFLGSRDADSDAELRRRSGALTNAASALDDVATQCDELLQGPFGLIPFADIVLLDMSNELHGLARGFGRLGALLGDFGELVSGRKTEYASGIARVDSEYQAVIASYGQLLTDVSLEH